MCFLQTGKKISLITSQTTLWPPRKVTRTSMNEVKVVLTPVIAVVFECMRECHSAKELVLLKVC